MIATRWLPAGLIAAFAFAAPPAMAADLYGEAPRYEEDYGGDRYAERYREERYDENGYGYGHRGSTKDGYLPPLERAPRFSDDGYGNGYGRGYGYGRHACAPKWQIRRRLVDHGWRNFERLAVRPDVVVLRAERPNGRAFDLKLDRCTGEIIAERPARHRGYGVYGPGPRRYGWAY
jgi:hypothetical protein